MNAVPLDVVRRLPQPPSSPNVQLNLNVRGLGPSATLAINERSARMRREGLQVYRMGLGQSPFPVPQSVVQVLRENAHQKDYLPVRGLEALREAVAAYHGRVNGVDRDAGDVLIGPGSKELMFILQLAFYGDLLVPSPSWVSYTPQAHIVGRRFTWIDTRREDGWRLQPEELEFECARDPDRPRILILNYPSNPLGVTYSAEALQRLAQVARRYRLVVLSDEIYGELHFDGGHTSIARFYPEGTIISSGLSKWCGAGGWRLGTFSFPKELHWVMDTMAVVASESFTTTSAPIQYAAVRAFQGGADIDRYLELSRRVIRALGPAVARRLRAAGCRVPEPEGGFYLMPDLSHLAPRLAARGITRGRQLCERILEDTGVAVLPGADFGRPADELSLRIAYVDFDGAEALRGAAAPEPAGELGDGFLRRYCAPVLEGVDRLAAWIAEV
jgi:aspartate aminotransferase